MKGDTFNFTISIQNDNSRKHELRSIDIEETLLVGINIIDTSIPTTEEYRVFGDQIYEFKSNLPGNSVTEAVFTAKALNSGDYSGEYDVCINGDASCLSKIIRIIIEE